MMSYSSTQSETSALDGCTWSAEGFSRPGYPLNRRQVCPRAGLDALET